MRILLRVLYSDRYATALINCHNNHLIRTNFFTYCHDYLLSQVPYRIYHYLVLITNYLIGFLVVLNVLKLGQFFLLLLIQIHVFASFFLVGLLMFNGIVPLDRLAIWEDWRSIIIFLLMLVVPIWTLFPS